MREAFYKRRAILVAVVLVCFVGFVAIACGAAIPGLDLGGSEIEDPVAPLANGESRTEQERDRLDALAHFAAGRMAQQRGDDAEAFRQYARAHREDPDVGVILREIVPVAFGLDRSSTAVRYALLAVEKEPTDPALIRRLAAYLAEDGQSEKALKLYEKATKLAEATKEKPNAAAVLTMSEMGRLNYIAKNYSQAADCFAQVIKALEDPKKYGLDEPTRKSLLGNSDVAYQLFGEAFFDAGRLDEAVAAYTKANELKPDAAQLALSLARIEFKRGHAQEALAKLEEYLKANRADEGVTPYQLLVEIFTQLGKKDEAIARLQQLQAADETNVPLRFFLAEHFRKEGKLDDAEAQYKQMLKPAKGRPPLEAFLGLLAIYQERQTAAPLFHLLGEVAGNAGSLQPLDEAKKKLTDDKKLTTALLAYADETQKADPGKLSFGDRLAAAELALSAERFEEADKWFALAMEIKPEKVDEALISWGLNLLMAERYGSAAKALRRGLDEKLIPTDNGAIYYYLAGALEMDGKTDEALAVARQGAELQKDSARFASRPGWILYHAKRHDEAVAEYKKFLEAFDDQYDSNDTRDAIRDARLVLSNIAVEQGRLAEAEEWLEQVLDEFPEDVGAQNDLGYLWADQNKHGERALRMTRRAVEAEPKNAAYRDSLGWALYRLGKYSEAVTELRQSLALDEKPDGVLFDHLGDALSKAGKDAEAKEAWGKAIAAFEKQGNSAKAAATKEKLTR